jgi:DNA-binding CsgD family transcriptional regulator
MTAERRSGGERRTRARFHLTPRDVAVLTQVLRGQGNKQIAAALGVTEQAIKEHVSVLLDKFEVPNRAALAEAGTRLEFAGEPGVDRSWMRELFLGAEPLICIARGPEIRYEAGNDAFAEAIGNRPFVGRTMRETFPELEGQGVFESTERVFATGQAIVEHEVVRIWDRGNGIEKRLMDNVIQPLHDDAGQVNGIAAFSLDVTELVDQRRSAELLHEEMAAVLDLLTSGVIVVDTEGRVLKINEAGKRIARQQVDQDSTLGAQAAEFDIRDMLGNAVAPGDRSLTRALLGDDIPPRDATFVAGDPPERVTIRISVRPLRGPDRSVRGALLLFTELGAEPV